MHFFLLFALFFLFLFHTIVSNGGNVDLGKLLNKKTKMSAVKKKKGCFYSGYIFY